MTPSAATPKRSEAVEILRQARRISTPGGVEELVEIQLGGVRQWISIRGKDACHPVLLFIHGGPGSPEMPASWLYQSTWEDYFVVVQWDQRGCGKSAAAAWPAVLEGGSQMGLFLSDAKELTGYLRYRFNRDKIFVLGHSWGTVLGTMLARDCPEWLHAYVGVGQVVEWRENERASYAYVAQRAQELGLADAVAELQAIAPYPEPAPGEAALQKLLIERKWVIQLRGMVHEWTDLDILDRAKSLSPEYTDADLDTAGQVETTVARLLPELFRYDGRQIASLNCPVVIAAGRFDYATPSSVARAWYENLQAPCKSWAWFDRSAHMPHIEEPGRFVDFLVHAVRPLGSR